MLDKHNPSLLPPRGLVILGGIQFKDRRVLVSLAHKVQTSPSLTLGSPSTGADAGVEEPPAVVTYNCWFSVTNGQFFWIKTAADVLWILLGFWGWLEKRNHESYTCSTKGGVRGETIRMVLLIIYIFTPISFLFFICINFGVLFGLIEVLGSLICESFIFKC